MNIKYRGESQILKMEYGIISSLLCDCEELLSICAKYKMCQYALHGRGKGWVLFESTIDNRVKHHRRYCGYTGILNLWSKVSVQCDLPTPGHRDRGRGGLAAISLASTSILRIASSRLDTGTHAKHTLKNPGI
jgi:hypothetical protein